MDYPQRFFQQLFASFRKLELARRFSIYFGLLSVLILFLAGMLVWAHKSQTVKPYFLHISDDGEWTVYSDRKKGSVAQPWFVRVQEAVAIKFAQDFFNISENSYENDNLWCSCDSAICNTGAYDKCKLCCASDRDLFDKLTARTASKWREKFVSGERMRLVDVVANPVGMVSGVGGLWEVRGNLVSNKNRSVKIFAYVRIANSGRSSSKMLGFFVMRFDFYGNR